MPSNAGTKQLAEAIKLCYADREAYYGDPNFAEVPIETLLSREYADRRRALIRTDEAWPEMPPPGDIGGGKTPAGATASSGQGVNPIHSARKRGLDTSYVCVVDKHGNAFSATLTDGALGDPVVPDTGMSVSHTGRSCWTDPNHPNSVEGGKRPRCGCIPALALHKGKQLMPFGTPGADVIMQAMVQVFLNVFVFGMDPQLAVEAPRFASYSFPESFSPHRYQPGLLKLERPIPEATGDALAGLGHKIEWWPNRFWQVGSVSAILKDLETGVMQGGADHRRGAYVVGW